MKGFFRLILIAAAAGVFLNPLPARGQASELEPQPFTHKTEKFTLQPPKGWIKLEENAERPHVIFVKPDSDENLIVSTEPAKGMEFTQYVDATLKNLTQSGNNYQILDEGFHRVNDGKIGYLIEASLNGEAGPVRNLQLILVVNDKAYVATATSPETQWEGNKELFQDSLNTLSVE